MDGHSLASLADELLERARQGHSGRAAQTVYGGHEHGLRQTLIALAGGHALAEHQLGADAQRLAATRPRRRT